jgi:hypothetical protein
VSDIQKSWLRGVADGMNGSGSVLGFIAPIAAFALVMTVLVIGIVSGHGWIRGRDKNEVCANYTFKLTGRSARCNRWPAMVMRIEKRWVKADLVHCACTEGSNPPPED